MQDKFAGDIGDYAKYALLRALSNNGEKRLGVAWYLHPDEDDADGRYIGYLDEPRIWRPLDEELFDGLARIVSRWRSGEGTRSVAEVEEHNLLPGAVFSDEVLRFQTRSNPKRQEWRSQWFKDVQKKLLGREIVFADPDKGLSEDDTNRTKKIWRGSNKEDLKRMPLKEACQLAKEPDGQKQRSSSTTTTPIPTMTTRSNVGAAGCRIRC